ncbi:MAG: DapH/DapD/GlmU-related protein [bacterium]
MSEIPADLQINALDSELGLGIRIGERTRIAGFSGATERLRIGRHVLIGNDVTILAPDIEIGDYTVIHNHTLIYGYGRVRIGAACWIGQNAVLNCSDTLEIGRGCTISSYANLWTHFSGGDVLQGCRFNSRQPLQLGEDCWIGVQCSVAPGSIGARSLLLAGSVLTKDMPADSVWGGNPARDMTARMGPPFEPRTPLEKYRIMCALLDRFCEGAPDQQPGDALPASDEPGPWPEDGYERDGILLTHNGLRHPMYSVFDTSDRSYSALDTETEVRFMRWLLPVIRFYAREGSEL